MMDLDLNLLRVFDALMELRSVTRVADRLGLTQSAVSHALGRLRRQLDDPLFLRGPQGFRPSPRAEEIAPSIRDGLATLRGALSPGAFDPGDSRRRFTIAASTYFCSFMIPALAEYMRRMAPGISLRIVPSSDRVFAWLDRGIIDLALGSIASLPSRFVIEPLFSETMVWIAAASNARLPASLGSASIAAQPRVMIAADLPFEMPRPSAADELRPPWIVRGNLERDTHPARGEVVTVYDSQAAVAMVAQTDLVALVPLRIAERAIRQEPIRILDHSAADMSFELSMWWHQKQRADKGLEWLRDTLRELV